MVTENTGVLIAQPNKTDFLAGALDYAEVCSDWTPYLPTKERQYTKYADTSACVSFSALNAIEVQMNYLLANDLIHADDKAWLEANGYIVNGKLEFSDRFIAKASDTMKNGNYMNKVWDTIRNVGLVPESDWAYNEEFNWDQYYAEIPAHLFEKGKKFLERFKIQYEWVITGQEGRQDQKERIAKYTKQAPVQIATLPIQGHPHPIADRGCGAQHATIIYGLQGGYQVFDHYEPFFVLGALNFCIPWAIRGIVIPAKTANIDVSQYEGKCIEAPSGKAYVVKDGKRYESPDALTWYSCGYTYEMIQKVSQTVVDLIPRATENGGYLNYKGSQHEKMFDSMRAHRHQFSPWLG